VAAWAGQVGGGAGVGSNLNFPMPTGEGDAAYCYAMLAHALPDVERFKPVPPTPPSTAPRPAPRPPRALGGAARG
jgi:hypothetical protein